MVGTKRHPKLLLSVLLGILLSGVLIACDAEPTRTSTPMIYVEESLVTDRPVTVDSVLPLLRSGIPTERITAALSLYQFDVDPEEAIPILIANLEYDGPHEVRETSAVALGRMSQTAEPAIPELIRVLQQGDLTQVRKAAAWALGEIGHSSAVPYLAGQLYYDDQGEYGSLSSASAESAQAIEEILNIDFTDEPEGRLNREGVPFIVIEARKWWETEGQEREWPPFPAAEVDND